MRLTNILCYYKHRMKCSGLMYEGKNRLIHPLTVQMKRIELNKLFIEKKNLELLEKPFLTQEESCGHTKALGKKEKRKREFLDSKNSKMFPHCFSDDELRRSLDVQKGWGNFN